MKTTSSSRAGPAPLARSNSHSVAELVHFRAETQTRYSARRLGRSHARDCPRGFRLIPALRSMVYSNRRPLVTIWSNGAPNL